MENTVWFKNWMIMFKLAERYFKKNGNLLIPFGFKTKNGTTYNSDGLSLGRWIQTQRQKYCGNKDGKLFTEQIDLLNSIGMLWFVKEDEETVNKNWMEKYSLVKNYYNHYGDLRITNNFKTNDGINYDKNGIKIGTWLNMQKQIYNSTSKMTNKQKELLEKLNIVWNKKSSWLDNYKLAENYYNANKNLSIDNKFKTSDGINYDEKGVSLGIWIKKQKSNENILTDEQKKLLQEIGLKFFKPNKKTKEEIEEVESKKDVEIVDVIEEPKNDVVIVDVIEEVKEEISNDTKVNNISLELDELIKKIESEKQHLLDKYNRLITEKRELESKSKNLNTKMNSILEELNNMSKKFLLNK